MRAGGYQVFRSNQLGNEAGQPRAATHKQSHSDSVDSLWPTGQPISHTYLRSQRVRRETGARKMSKPMKSNQEIAMILTFRGARTEMGKRVQAAVLARVEITMMIAESTADLETDVCELIDEEIEVVWADVG